MESDPSKPDLTGALRRGMRVVLRHRLADGSATDSVGDLVDIGAERVTVHTRRGPEVIERAQIILGKQVPPAPPRRRR